MARHLRPQIPGVPFHITSRAQAKLPIFVGVESTVVGIIEAGTEHSDARVLAYAVMPNHLHIILLQGSRPLHAYMQPVLRRIALLIHGRKGTEGHVFERRFHSSPCLEPEYFRNAIAYVHLNGTRAGLCSGPDFEWCTHAAYCAPDLCMGTSGPARDHALRLFARDEHQTTAQCIRDYLGFLSWRSECDIEKAKGEDRPLPERPCTFGGDRHWLRTYGPAALRYYPQPPKARPDLRDLARYTLADIAPEMTLGQLRSGGREKPLVQVRRMLIRRARSSGHSITAIARFLQVSPTTVSSASTRK